MHTLIADTFQASLTGLDSIHHGAVKAAAYDLQTNPAHPSFQFHRVERTKEKNFWTARVNVDIRMVVYKDGNHLILCYVDHHDAAYRWAENRRFSLNEMTGAVQIVVSKEVINEIVKSVVVVQEQEAPRPKLFADYPGDYLLALSVPESYLDAVKLADEAMFLNQLMGILPEEAAENLARLATGEVVPRPSLPKVKDPFLHPDAQRRFRVVDKDPKALERALNVPWEKWAIFLHPTQQEVVDRSYSGPARVTGGAGTGKTVVALHRAAHLARADGNAKILLTTFSRTLAARLQYSLTLLLGPNAPELKQIRVANLHSVAAEIWNEASKTSLTIFDPQKDLAPLMRQAVTAAGVTDMDQIFLEAEWTAVVDTEGITTWEVYKTVSRAGRGTALGARQRLRVWKVFEALHDLLDTQGLRTWQRVCYEVAFLLSQRDALPYDHVIADEVQDFGPAELRLLRAFAPEGRDDILVTGDLGQRIYKGQTSFLGAGIDIRGRSMVLKLNYRTTEQIRRFADTLLPTVIQSLDGDSEERLGVSILSGPEPKFAFERSVKSEIDTVEKWLRKQLSSGFKPHEVAIFARTNNVIRDRVKHVVGRCGLSYHELSDHEPPREKRISVGTMHRAKGLEFKVVIVMGCEDGQLPLQSVLEKLPDEASRAMFAEQERNLFYVACTRTRERLLISCAGVPSRLVSKEKVSEKV